MAKSEFASQEDMAFYDDGCVAHDVLRAAAKDLGMEGPPMTVYFEPSVTASL